MAEATRAEEELAKTPLGMVIAELSAVRDHPRMLTLVAHGFVEIIVNALVKEECTQGTKIAGDSRAYPHATKIVLLNEMGVLSDHHRKLLDWFRTLRNDFAHDPFFKLTPDALDIFVNSEFRKPENFVHVCYAILLDLFQTHSAAIGHTFAPSLCEEVETKYLVVEEPGPVFLIPLKTDPKRIECRLNAGDVANLSAAIATKKKQARTEKGLAGDETIGGADH